MKKHIQQFPTHIDHPWSISILFFSLLVSTMTCQKWDLDTTDFIEVITSDNTNIENTKVTVFGEIKGLIQGNSVDQLGHVWSSTIDDVTLENKEGQSTLSNRGNGEFSSTLEGLRSGTVYNYRAYALFGDELIYGTIRTFTIDSLSFNAVVDSFFNLTQSLTGFQVEARVSIFGLEQGLAINEYGVAWGVQPQPDIEEEEDHFISKGSTIADGLTITFDVLLTELQPGLIYIRPYLIIGGLPIYGNEMCLEISDVWVRKEDFGGVGRALAVAFSINDKGYFGTGIKDGGGLLKDFWEYDPASDTWTQRADFGGVARRDAVGFSINDKGYIGTGEAEGFERLKDFWEYDPQSNTWTQRADFGGGDRNEAVGFSINEKGYIGTGTNSGLESVKDFWEYDPQSDNWSQRADFGGVARSEAVGFSINNKGYVGTGENSGFQDIKDFWEYDPQSNTWTQRANFGGVARRRAVGVSINDNGYIGIGFNSGFEFFKDFWEYNPQSDNWIQRLDFGGIGGFQAVGFSINDKGYIGTGTYLGNEIKDFWEYTPDLQK